MQASRRSRTIIPALIFCLAQVVCAEDVHMLIPGFTVRELPVHLSNVNNIRFSPDGRLFALGYDGKIHVLKDSDGDGLEDQDDLFWDKPSITVPVGMAVNEHGVFVSSHGKVSFFPESGQNGKAEREEIIASGWLATDVASGGVDAIGVTLNKDGDAFFGLIAADYSNPYRVKDGVSHYELTSKRGTIQKWSHTSRQLETIATGIRVPYSLLFNKHGDLFCTDQEGETWCPNGNPLDELNQIVPGRNYGFPPRDPKWLPQLESEAPVVGFGPQHQSACGMVFNEPHRGQRLFGPKWWEGDLFVAGESRGKIWRVRLVKTDHGYVGQSQLIARLSMLTMDLAISPHGELYVCCHSGQPDWGTGPRGSGRIFKITYTDREAPQPVLAWAATPTTVKVFFDRPLAPAVASATNFPPIEFGDYVSAADRLEKLKPPYQVVTEQQASPRGKLRVIGSHLQDAQTLELRTDPHPLAAVYALTIPGVKSTNASGAGYVTDLAYEVDGSVNLTSQIQLMRNLPFGSALGTVLTKQFFSLGKKPPAYPYIHEHQKVAKSAMSFEGADYERGRQLFFGEKLKCSSCHRIRGDGSTFGPDLSNLSAKDPRSVLRDITEPSASINPDYVSYNLTLSDEESITGFVRSQDEKTLKVSMAAGKERVLSSSEIRRMEPSSISLMPSGLLAPLSEAQILDLQAFLVWSPPTRAWSDVETVLKSSKSKTTESKHLRVTLVASKQDHGPGQHDYPAWQKSWSAWLAGTGRIEVTNAWLWPTADQFEASDVVIFYYWNHEWDARHMEEIDRYLAAGKGAVLLHSGTIANPMPEQLAERFGLTSESQRTAYRHLNMTVRWDGSSSNDFTKGFSKETAFLDEMYWPMIGDVKGVKVLASTKIEGKEEPVCWTFEHNTGRVFGNILGHYTWTLDDPWYRLLTLRAIAWTGKLPVNDLDLLLEGVGGTK